MPEDELSYVRNVAKFNHYYGVEYFYPGFSAF